MFLSISQIELSLKRLEGLHPFFGMSFLVFKRSGIPIGQATEMVFAREAADLLNEYYKPSSGYEGYYTPFQPSKNKSHWLGEEYYHRALQRITSDTFRDVTIHPKDSSEWGWRTDYVEGLKGHLKDDRIPAFDLAVWLFRSLSWPSGVKPNDLVDKLFSTFSILKEEVQELFDVRILLAKSWLSIKPVSERELLRIIGRPPGSSPEEGAALDFLELHGVGPATTLDYRPSERVNIITGDNSLGKTFLLDCIWWALTGEWIEGPVYPKATIRKKVSSISFGIKTSEGSSQTYRSSFDWKAHAWVRLSNRRLLAGLVVYARYDGSFAVWDPAKVRVADNQPGRVSPVVRLNKDALWNGLTDRSSYGTLSICNGLLRDWVQWQVGGPMYADHYKALTACLDALSPSQSEPLRMGKPTRIPFTSQEIPTLVMPYGEIAANLTSAGVQRAIAIAYTLVWAWFEHLENSRLIRKRPQRRLVFLIDEVEAHLHPRWQRVIVPALMKVIEQLSVELTPQVHLATHSPLVMASTEAFFEEETDDLHHLRLVGDEVVLEELPYVKRGTADQWLVSNVFELRQARSIEGETAIEEAKALQTAKKPDPQKVRDVNEELIKYLAPDDEFWPRWRFFAKRHGLLQ
jgi:hypothetical protein